MTTLKKRYVKKSRKWHTCDDCGRMIKQGSPYTYLYGSAHDGETPYALHICQRCQEAFDNMLAGIRTEQDEPQNHRWPGSIG